MNRITKRTALICALLLAFVSSSCSGKPESAPAEPGSSAPPSVAEEETVTYHIFRNAGYIQGYAEDGGEAKPVILEQLAKAGITGVDYEVMIGSGDEYFTKLNAFAASDSLPDYFNVDFPTMTKFADQELIVPLDDLMAQNAPHLVKVQKESDLNTIRYNGKVYALPPGYRPEEFNGPNSDGLVYRKDWLDKLGLAVPTTLDEMHDVLKAFTEQDPDGNGQNDTTGLIAYPNGDIIPAFSPIYAAYGMIPHFWYEHEGRLQQGSTLPQAREALALLRSWYEEGIIDKDYPVAQRTQVEEKFVNSRAGCSYLSALDVNTTTPVPVALKAANPDAVMVMSDPPKGPDGRMGYAENQPGYGDIRAISASTKQPEKLMQVIDWSVDDSETGGFYLVTYGIEGEDYTYDREANRIHQISNNNDLYKKGYSNPVRFAQLVDRRWMESEDAFTALEITNGNAVPNLFWNTVPAMLEYADTLGLWQEYSTKIITGQLPLEGYDEFLEKYYAQGGQTIEDQVNEEYAKLK